MFFTKYSILKKNYYPTHFVLTIFFLLIFSEVNAQRAEGILKGKIISSDGKEAASVTIELRE